LTPLRVTIVAPWGERLGGAEECLWQGLRRFRRDALEPTVVFLGPGAFVDDVARLGMATAVIPAGRLRQPKALVGTVLRLRQFLRSEDPDLVLSWSAKAHLYAAPAAVAAGLSRRLLWWQHMIPNGHWVDRLATRLPATAIACSSDASREAQASLRPRRPTFVVNPGVDLEVRGGKATDVSGNGLDIPRERLVVGIVGRLQPWKGQDRFVGALAELRGRGHDVHGLIVGGDAYGLAPEYPSELRRLIDRLGLDGRVTMTGQVDDAAPYYEVMDVAVNASEGEPFGMVLLEAMAAGVPVVAVREGGPIDIINHGVTGMLADGGAPEALAAAIDGLLADPNFRTSAGKAARQSYEERFTAERMADELTARLREVARV
jgi:glycosyltransferase involved in cell wall biosynthesis